MDVVTALTEQWPLLVTWMCLLFIIIFYFEHRRWDYLWNYKRRAIFKPKEQWYVIYQDYIQWWNGLYTTPDKIVIRIQQNIINYLETEYPHLTTQGYSRRGIGRIAPFLPYITDKELSNFLLDPIEWIKPHLNGKLEYFYSDDKELLKLGLLKLLPVFHELHQRIYQLVGYDLGNDWEKIYGTEKKLERIFTRKKRLLSLKILVIDIGILLGIIILFYPFISGEAPFFVLVMIVLSLIIFLVSLTGLFQKYVWNSFETFVKTTILKKATKKSDGEVELGDRRS